jgi:tRNA(adenine34) deaminase
MNNNNENLSIKSSKAISVDAERDLFWMRHALELARHAEAIGEVPIGAVVISDTDNTVLGEGWNCPISTNDPTAHAEIIAMRQAAQHLNNYRLVDATLYVTLEPCLMCVGAMLHARIKRLIFGAHDPKAGAVLSVFHALDTKLNHHLSYRAGILSDECGALLKRFFQQKR